MNSLNLGGHSGCGVFLIEAENGQMFVRKTSKDPAYNERLKAQCTKQKGFQGHNLKTPAVLQEGLDENGCFYFDMEYVQAMKGLCAEADYIVPNITEACFLTGLPYKTEYDRDYINSLLDGLTALGCKNVILTGVSYTPGKTGIVVYENGVYAYYEHIKLSNSCHGTGDTYASAFVGALMGGKSAYDAARIAGDYVVECIKTTAKLDNHWYGAAFEPVLGKLIEMLK